MGQPQTLESVNHRLLIQWNRSPGVPLYSTKTAGNGYRTVRRTLRKTLQGQQDFRTPQITSLPGAGAPSVPTAIEVASGLNGVVFKQTSYIKHRNRAEWTWDVLDLAMRGDQVYLNNGGDQVKRLMNGIVQRSENVQSSYFWGDGGGVLARVDPSSTIMIGDTTIKLLLPRTVLQFEEQTENQDTGNLEGGDLIEFSTSKGTPGAGGSVKTSYRPRVASARRTAGELTLDPPIPDDGFGNPVVQPGDYIFYAENFGQAVIGHAGWVPLNGSDAFLSNPFFGVKRNRAPEKLAGLRVKIGQGQDPYPKITKILEQMMVNGTKVNRIFTTPEEWRNIQDSAESLSRKLNGRMDLRADSGDRKMSYYRKGKGEVTMAYDLPSRLVFPSYTGDTVMIMPDEYLYDVDQGPDGQSLYRGFTDEHYKLYGTMDGSYVWANYDSNGPIYTVQGQELTEATWLIRSIYTNENARDGLVASPNVVIS